MAKLIEQFIHPKHSKLYLQHRSDSKFLQAVAFLDGKKQQWSTRTAHLPTALRLAEDEYLKRLRALAGEPVSIKRALHIPILEELFTSWKGELTGAKLAWAEMKWDGPVARFWEAKRVTEISTQTFKEFYKWRRTQKTQFGTKPKNATLHQDMILVRQILKYAVEEGHLDTLPAIPAVGQSQPNPRPWLTWPEWRALLRKAHARKWEDPNPRVRRQRIELIDQMLWMISTMMRVGEMLNVRLRDCRMEHNRRGSKILLCEVQGKRGQRMVVGGRRAYGIYEKRRKDGAQENDLLFPVHHDDALTELLKATELHLDPRSGFTRNFKSLRCTAISFAVLRGVDLMWIARNAGTSVTMIDQFYARRLSAEMAKDALTARD